MILPRVLVDRLSCPGAVVSWLIKVMKLQSEGCGMGGVQLWEIEPRIRTAAALSFRWRKFTDKFFSFFAPTHNMPPFIFVDSGGAWSSVKEL